MLTKSMARIMFVLTITAVSTLALGTTYYVDISGNDEANGLSWDTAFATIQEGLDSANNYDVIEVNEGIYNEAINFNGTSCILTSTEPNNWDIISSTIISNNTASGYAVIFNSYEDANSVLSGFTIEGLAGHGIYCGNSTSPTITRCMIINSVCGMNCISSSPTIINNKIIGNSNIGIYSDSGGPIIKNNWICENNRGILAVVSTATVQNNTIAHNINYGIQKGMGTNLTVTNCILWDNGDDMSSGLGATYSCISDVNDADGTGNITNDPCFVNVFDFIDEADVNGTTTTMVVTNASLYEVGDVVEYDNDGVIRTTTDVNVTTNVITFNNALDINSVAETRIHNWGTGVTDVNEDFHIEPNSLCSSAGDPNGDYDGEVDIDGELRLQGTYVNIDSDPCLIIRVNIGADESGWVDGDDIDPCNLPPGFSWNVHGTDWDYRYLDPNDENPLSCGTECAYTGIWVSKYYTSETRLFSTHAQTSQGNKLPHYHEQCYFEDLCCPIPIEWFNYYWTYHYLNYPDIDLIKNASNKHNCICYAFDQILTDSTYNYWLAEVALQVMDDDMYLIEDINNVAPNDLLVYGFYYTKDPFHITIVKSVSSNGEVNEPNLLEWKWSVSPVYQIIPDPNDAFSTPGCSWDYIGNNSTIWRKNQE